MNYVKGGIAPLRKGEIKEVNIESLAIGGEGVSKDFPIPIFINRVAPGDRVEVEIFDVRKSFARAHVLRIITPSPLRVEPPCPLFKVCGGCQLQHISYEQQLIAKHNFVEQAFKHIGGLATDKIKPAIAASNDLHYRNKVQFPVKQPKNSDRILAGYYKQDSHELVNIKFCPVQSELLDDVLDVAKELCEFRRIPAYDEVAHTGVLRHIAARHSLAHDQVLVTFVCNVKGDDLTTSFGKTLKEKMLLIADEMMSELPEVVGVGINLNSAVGNRIMSENTVTLRGVDRLEEVLSTKREDLPEHLREGIKYQLSATSFFQVNTAQAVALFEQVYDGVKSDRTNDEPVDLIIDAYAGVGAISLWLAPVAKKVIAIEEHPAAVADGIKNAELNNIENVEFKQASVEEALLDCVKQGIRPDVVVVDPPRKGLTDEARSALLELAPERIVYVSCNPATLARDLKIFESGATGASYTVVQVQPVDLFPHTHHIESVTLLQRVDSSTF